MTRVKFFVNVTDKLAKVASLCDEAVAKGRQLTVLTQGDAMNQALQQQLWRQSPTSFLVAVTPEDVMDQRDPIVFDTDGKKLVQDDILINLQAETPLFFSRFKQLIEIVGADEADKEKARVRYKFYKDRGYEIKSTDVAKMSEGA